MISCCLLDDRLHEADSFTSGKPNTISSSSVRLVKQNLKVVGEDACFVCMTVKRVVNQSGPQVSNSRQDAVSQHILHTVIAGSASQTAEFPLPAGISERLSSMETHLRLSAGKCSKSKPGWVGIFCVKFCVRLSSLSAVLIVLSVRSLRAGGQPTLDPSAETF